MNMVISDKLLPWINLQIDGRPHWYRAAPDVEDAIALLDADLKPKNALEVGSGIGRGSVYLSKRLGWDETTFWLLDGDSTGKKNQKQIACVHANESLDHIYNSMEAAAIYCGDNGLNGRVELVNVAKWEAFVKRLVEQGVMFDVAYSFKSIGFHWPVAGYLKRLAPFMREGSLFVFETRPVAKRFLMSSAEYLEGPAYHRARQKHLHNQLEAIRNTPHWKFVRWIMLSHGSRADNQTHAFVAVRRTAK